MASLLDLTVQGDVGTISDESKLPEIRLMGPLELYRLWERQNWASHEISLEQDRRDWEALPAEERESMLWGLSAFFVGEERVTNQFSGLVMAAEDKHEEAFLLTQQVDEARHAQHFNRLYEEVFRYDGAFEDRLERARMDLNDDYITLFDGHLVGAHQALLDDPRSVEAKVDFITIYHMVIEGTLALTGQRFQTERIERRGILPGHLEAFQRIARDEHRHVAYGTWFLQRKARDPELAKRVQDKLAETLPAAAGVLVPPGYQLGDEYEYLGFTSQEMNEYAFTALSRRLKVIGIGLPAAA
ncbi:MAG TPA: ribonucleotide-diphosphate reductase subunit beta [Solirubrobacteraceae bacterium]|nr:ribonucleotide-diphosphate reductase subunit beta [Solirubrobacteraceae bacterium]